MEAIVESYGVRAEVTRYEVPGWGAGELWTIDEIVLAHDFGFDAVLRTVSDTALNTARRSLTTADESADTTSRNDAGLGCGKVGADLSELHLDKRRCLTPQDLVARFAAFFAGHEVSFEDVALDLSTFTPFQRAVAETLREVPRGEIVSYGELAALAGYQNAQRAVGTFCARNRFMILVPCHRVVAADGVGSYGSAGSATKRRLLELEGVAL